MPRTPRYAVSFPGGEDTARNAKLYLDAGAKYDEAEQAAARGGALEHERR